MSSSPGRPTRSRGKPPTGPPPKGVYVGDIVTCDGKTGIVTEIDAALRVKIRMGLEEWWVDDWKGIRVVAMSSESRYYRKVAK